METISCTVERITYHNKDNGYSVIKTRVKNFRDLVTVTGYFAEIHIGSSLEITGEWSNNPKYGRQFSASEWIETLPATVGGIEKYLGSGIIKGIGPKTAKKIVEHFGESTIDIIENEPHRLIEIPGLNDNKISQIHDGFIAQREIRNLVLFLQSCNVNTALAARIYNEYGMESINIIKENPYRLSDEIWGIGFRTADMIAQKIDFGSDRFYRIRSGIMFTLNRIAEDGHCFTDRDQLIKKSSELLGTEDCNVSMTLDNMIMLNEVIRDEEAHYLPPFFFSERGTAERVKQILSSKEEKPIQNINKSIGGVQSAIHIQYDDIQLNAIKCALQNKITIITGGPGTGKTTTTVGIIQALKINEYRILLAAPTGKAAKRLTETTGMQAKTLHRLLEYNQKNGCKKDENNPLKCDVVIIDECSMIDIILMYNLLKAIPDNAKIIFIGDADQLPSVGAGNVFSDMINSGVIPVVRLNRIFRQAEKSMIIKNAHRIKDGVMPDLSVNKNSDFFFIEESDPDKAAFLIKDLCKNRLPAKYQLNPLKDIQVLTPMTKGAAGVTALNMILQKALNNENVSLSSCGIEYKLNDKVMQIRNNYDKDIYNGDTGTISRIDIQSGAIDVLFDGKTVHYEKDELDELTLSYATTIHKSQGSEFSFVIIPILKSHKILLQRNLLYTGITRAKRMLILVGDKQAIQWAVSNNNVVKRNTLLMKRLQLTTIKSE